MGAGPVAPYLRGMIDASGNAPGDRPSRDEAARPPDPLAAARGPGKPAGPRRFYATAAASPAEGGYALTLDGRPTRTPGRAPLVVPTLALAEALAAEWTAQGETIEPATMPLTRLANTAVDGVVPEAEAVRADAARYAGSDLLAYRAGEPDRLVAMQAAAWDPVLDWAREALGARFVLSEGVMHVDQPPDSLAAVRRAVEAVPLFALAPLHVMTTLTGSVLLALAVLRGRLAPDAAWSAAHVDEDYQASVWGSDAEAVERREARAAEFRSAARFLELLGG